MIEPVILTVRGDEAIRELPWKEPGRLWSLLDMFESGAQDSCGIGERYRLILQQIPHRIVTHVPYGAQAMRLAATSHCRGPTPIAARWC